MKKLAAILIAALLAASVMAQQAPVALSDGEIRRVDRDAKKITIRHGPIPSLDMPPMTMVFQVKDAADARPGQGGRQGEVQAERVGGALTVTKIQPAQ